ncbi:MAG: prepilin peptidase [Candidatus Nealsonbacteria bacterium CG_4_10_14_0_2_um_filter_39_15]|uniref:Prepilin peptidase n=1 Tax=Candidatus Nealsonbacteria bacterium CG_4_10_14_0_2_um_filter_39_15 TaxID=1974681 RepID=A0A2M7UVK0_9BACT|nr:MAG: prepilin peptidase [Candidatus Nealsonbacteria bacterium CG_4_10_14_0_2_um_filter_39_15]
MPLNHLFYLAIPLFGLVMGSFLNCIIYRLQTGESFLKGRSFCPHCRHALSWQDLIPVFSFLILKGKCRYCQKPISWQYPLVELATGIIFLLIVWNLEFGICLEFGIWNLLFYLLISCFLIIIFVYDLKHYIIPDAVIYPAIAIAFLYQLFRMLNFVNWNLFGIWNVESGILRPISSAFLASLFFLAIVFLSQGKWMGLGDVKLAFLMGLFLGFPNILVALFLAFFIGAIIGIGLIISGKRTLKSEVPFGPFLITGTFIALFWGNQITNWYLSLFI